MDSEQKPNLFILIGRKKNLKNPLDRPYERWFYKQTHESAYTSVGWCAHPSRHGLGPISVWLHWQQLLFQR